MATSYKIPMSKLVLTLFLCCMAVIAGAVTWSFNSGFTWSGICLIIVAGPLSIFYWYMLYINPKRATVTVADEGILLSAPPFSSAVIPWASVEKVFPAKLTDPAFAIHKTKKIMQFAGYNSGIVELAGGKEAIIVANRPDILCIQTGERYYLIGPSDLVNFIAEVETTFNK